MSDIVERLRERPFRMVSETEAEAKERRQREREEGAAEIERLRAALRAILNVPANWGSEIYDIEEIARAALEDRT